MTFKELKFLFLLQYKHQLYIVLDYGICNLSIVPIRSNNSHKSELISQLLYGDCFKLLAEEKDWIKIITLSDEYTGWIDKKQFVHISKDIAEEISFNTKSYSNRLIDYIETSENKLACLLLGSNIGACKFLGHKFDGPFQLKSNKKSDLLKTASLYLNSPYLWGGKTPIGIDCSGLTQMTYRINGHLIPRDASLQSEIGETLSFIDESQAGDLAFFDDDEGKIIHVGILLENNYILHSHGKVRIDRIDQTGIYNLETKKHSHKLRIIKKIF